MEELFNQFLETSLKYYGEEDDNAEKERHEVKEILFDEMWYVFSTLEKGATFWRRNREDGKGYQDREQRKTATGMDGIDHAK